MEITNQIQRFSYDIDKLRGRLDPRGPNRKIIFDLKNTVLFVLFDVHKNIFMDLRKN